MNTAVISGTAANAAIGISYFYLAHKNPTLRRLNVNNKLTALAISRIVHAFFHHLRNRVDSSEKSTREIIIKYSLPYVLLGGASLTITGMTLKIGLLSTAILGTSQAIASALAHKVENKRINASEFGDNEWLKYLGVEIPNPPKLPANIKQRLNELCPFWGDQGKKVRDTHVLVLIPATVRVGDEIKPFNLNVLEDLVKHPTMGYNAGTYSSSGVNMEQVNNATVSESYWILMTKKVIPDKNNFYEKNGFNGAGFYENKEVDIDQLNLFQDLDDRYTVPSVLEAVTAILTHYVRRGESLYKNGRIIRSGYVVKTIPFTVCKENNLLTHEPFYVGDYFGFYPSLGVFSLSKEVREMRQQYNDDEPYKWRMGGIAGVQRLPSPSY